MVGKRIASAIVLIALTGCVMYFGGIYLMSYGVFFSVMGIYELIRLEKMENTAVGFVAYLTAAAVFLYAYVNKGSGRTDEFVILVPAVLFSLLLYVISHKKYTPIRISFVIFSVAYVAGLLAFAFHLRDLDGGSWFIWLVLIVASGCDTFAYIVGSLIGKHKFTQISPKKTIEGCVGGIVGACLLTFIYSCFLPDYIVKMFSVDVHIVFLVIGFMGAIFSQIGDLVASAIKRHYDIKDYSDLIPGHGGIMDRIDSILFVSPVIYFILKFFMML